MTSRTLQRQIGAARVEQIKRVNGDSTDSQIIADLEQEVARLQERLRLARERIRQLEAAALDADDIDGPAATMTYRGRKSTTPQKAAEFYGAHVSTIIRRLQAGKIAGEQMPGSNRWVVYLDQPVAPIQKKGRKKKK